MILSHTRFISSPKFGLNIVDSRPKLVAGSPEGFPGHVDGKVREARMNHPKGFTLDDWGNIYVADAMNMAIRKISDTGKLKCPVECRSIYFCLFLVHPMFAFWFYSWSCPACIQQLDPKLHSEILNWS